METEIPGRKNSRKRGLFLQKGRCDLSLNEGGKKEEEGEEEDDKEEDEADGEAERRRMRGCEKEGHAEMSRERLRR